MQSKILIVTLVIVGMFAYTSAQCHPLQPIDNYNPLYIHGRFYLVAMEKAFAYQDKEERCTSSQITDPSLQTFPDVITYQDNNGTPQTIILSVENISPPGTYNISGPDGRNFRAVLLGAIQDKLYILYACNDGNERGAVDNRVTNGNRIAVWIYYSSRVQGFEQMDADSQRYVRRTLTNNNIPRNDLHDIDNSNCNNDN